MQKEKSTGGFISRKMLWSNDLKGAIAEVLTQQFSVVLNGKWLFKRVLCASSAWRWPFSAEGSNRWGKNTMKCSITWHSNGKFHSPHQAKMWSLLLILSPLMHPGVSHGGWPRRYNRCPFNYFTPALWTTSANCWGDCRVSSCVSAWPSRSVPEKFLHRPHMLLFPPGDELRFALRGCFFIWVAQETLLNCWGSRVS